VITPKESALNRYSRIGLFDSGLGGLSVLRRLAAVETPTPRSFVYLGDTARCPYGNRHGEEISLFVDQIVSWLLTMRVEAIVMACNTSAAVARKVADAVATVPVYDLIGVTAQALAQVDGRIGVMATVSTARSQAFSRALLALNPEAQVIEYGCPELVPIVESGTTHTLEAREILSEYVERLIEADIRTVILGCTHFPFLRRQLESLSVGRITFVDPAEILSGIISNDAVNSTSELFVTGDATAFARAARGYLRNIQFETQNISVDTLEACRTERVFAIAQDTVTPPVVPASVQ
jgi:glutamate racemase